MTIAKYKIIRETSEHGDTWYARDESGHLMPQTITGIGQDKCEELLREVVSRKETAVKEEEL